MRRYIYFSPSRAQQNPYLSTHLSTINNQFILGNACRLYGVSPDFCLRWNFTQKAAADKQWSLNLKFLRNTNDQEWPTQEKNGRINLAIIHGEIFVVCGVVVALFFIRLRKRRRHRKQIKINRGYKSSAHNVVRCVHFGGQLCMHWICWSRWLQPTT